MLIRNVVRIKDDETMDKIAKEAIRDGFEIVSIYDDGEDGPGTYGYIIVQGDDSVKMLIKENCSVEAVINAYETVA